MEESTNAAILVLENRIAELKEGFNCIPTQKKNLDELKRQVKKAEIDLAHDKRDLIQLEESLALLKAGE